MESAICSLHLATVWIARVWQTTRWGPRWTAKAQLLPAACTEDSRLDERPRPAPRPAQKAPPRRSMCWLKSLACAMVCRVASKLLDFAAHRVSLLRHRRPGRPPRDGSGNAISDRDSAVTALDPTSSGDACVGKLDADSRKIVHDAGPSIH